MKTRLTTLSLFVFFALILVMFLAIVVIWADNESRFDEVHTSNEQLRQDLQGVLLTQQQRMEDIESEQQRLTAVLNDFLEDLRTRYTEHEALLEQKLEPLAVAPDPRQYPIEEVAFLLHIAQYKHIYLYDAEGARAALQQAEQTLAELDEVRYHPLMQRLTEALAVLDTVDFAQHQEAHKVLSASWITLDQTIGGLRNTITRYNPESLPDADGNWTSWLADQVRITRGAPQAHDTISAYRHILYLYAVQTELYMARLSLQTYQEQTYTDALTHAQALLTQPALDGKYPALLASIDHLLARKPFPPQVRYTELLRILARVR